MCSLRARTVKAHAGLQAQGVRPRPSPHSRTGTTSRAPRWCDTSSALHMCGGTQHYFCFNCCCVSLLHLT